MMPAKMPLPKELVIRDFVETKRTRGITEGELSVTEDLYLIAVVIQGADDGDGPFYILEIREAFDKKTVRLCMENSLSAMLPLVDQLIAAFRPVPATIP